METTSGEAFESHRPLAPDTLAVRGGLMRSGFDETAEALYLTSGFVYASAEEAEAAFTDEIEKFIYSRYGNPTVAMFEERMRDWHMLDVSAPDLAALGRRLFEDTLGQIQELAADVAPGRDWVELMEEASQDHPTAEGLLGA